MGFHISFTLFFLSLPSLLLSKPDIKSAPILDLLIRDYTFRSYNNTLKTGEVLKINLPANLTGLNIEIMRLRCGSLQRYGVKLEEFYLNNGLNVHPCITRLLLVKQNIGFNFSSLYYNNFELSGYQLISPILGLLAYSLDGVNRTELRIESRKDAIKIDFSNTTLLNTSSKMSPLCASFDRDGKVRLSNQNHPNVCVATSNGHFGLVVESPLMPLKGKVGKVKIVVVSSIGAALGAFLLSLLVIAMFVNAKKKARMDELERRAYEEEALQVSMVGHVRALTASGTRTMPVIEHHHQYPIPYS